MGNEQLVAIIEGFYISHPWIFKNRKVLDAFRAVDRAEFLREELRGQAYGNVAVSIQSGQTCSQPQMIAVMANALELQSGQNVLLIGTGSGYTDAIFYETMGRDGRLVTVEIDEKLHETGRQNLENHFGPLVV